MRFTVTRWVARIYWLRLENEDRLKNIPTITQPNAETIETGLTTMTRKKIGPLTVREDRARSSRQRRMTTQSHRAVGGWRQQSLFKVVRSRRHGVLIVILVYCQNRKTRLLATELRKLLLGVYQMMLSLVDI